MKRVLGFTLIELLVIIAILGVMFSVISNSYQLTTWTSTIPLDAK